MLFVCRHPCIDYDMCFVHICLLSLSAVDSLTSRERASWNLNWNRDCGCVGLFISAQ